MEVTKVIIRRIFDDPGNNVKAVASIVFDNEFTVHELRIIKGVQRIFVAMPNRHSTDGKIQDIAHPLQQETRDKIEDAVLNTYYRFMESGTKGREVS